MPWGCWRLGWRAQLQRPSSMQARSDTCAFWRHEGSVLRKIVDFLCKLCMLPNSMASTLMNFRNFGRLYCSIDWCLHLVLYGLDHFSQKQALRARFKLLSRVMFHARVQGQLQTSLLKIAFAFLNLLIIWDHFDLIAFVNYFVTWMNLCKNS